MTIAAVLQGKGSSIETIAADASLFDAVRRLGEKRIGALPVVEDGRIVGIVSERDIIYCLREHGRDALDWPVEPRDELAGDHRRFADTTSSMRSRSSPSAESAICRWSIAARFAASCRSATS